MATTRLTPEQKLAKLDAERDKIKAALEMKADPTRPAALKSVIEHIKAYSFTRVELADAWPRKLPFKARGPRKVKVAA